jgi:hypothetical protein
VAIQHLQLRGPDAPVSASREPSGVFRLGLGTDGARFEEHPSTGGGVRLLRSGETRVLFTVGRDDGYVWTYSRGAIRPLGAR